MEPGAEQRNLGANIQNQFEYVEMVRSLFLLFDFSPL
jgi:hypothetical protein